MEASLSVRKNVFIASRRYFEQEKNGVSRLPGPPSSKNVPYVWGSCNGGEGAMLDLLND